MGSRHKVRGYFDNRVTLVTRRGRNLADGVAEHTVALVTRAGAHLPWAVGVGDQVLNPDDTNSRIFVPASQLDEGRCR